MAEFLRKRAGMPESSRFTSASSPRDAVDLTMIEPDTIQSMDSYHSARTYEVNTEKGGRKLMSEEEVSSLVHNALRRARQATKKGSRASSPLVRHGVTTPTPPLPQMSASKPPISPKKYSTNFTTDGEPGQTLSPLSRARMSRTGLPPKFTRVNESPSMGEDVFATPAGSFEHSINPTISALSIDSSDFQVDSALPPSSANASYDNQMDSSMNSSEDIIRRVEAEIANARKAAQEANRRLAGVSANMQLSTDDLLSFYNANVADDPVEKKYSMESDNPSYNYGSAMNVLAAEFEDLGSYGAEPQQEQNVSKEQEIIPVEEKKSADTHNVESIDSAGSAKWLPLEERSSVEDYVKKKMSELGRDGDKILKLGSESMDKERYNVDPVLVAPPAEEHHTEYSSAIDQHELQNRNIEDAEPDPIFTHDDNGIMTNLSIEIQQPNGEVIDLTEVESTSFKFVQSTPFNKSGGSVASSSKAPENYEGPESTLVPSETGDESNDFLSATQSPGQHDLDGNADKELTIVTSYSSNEDPSMDRYDAVEGEPTHTETEEIIDCSDMEEPTDSDNPEAAKSSSTQNLEVGESLDVQDDATDVDMAVALEVSEADGGGFELGLLASSQTTDDSQSFKEEEASEVERLVENATTEESATVSGESASRAHDASVGDDESFEGQSETSGSNPGESFETNEISEFFSASTAESGDHFGSIEVIPSRTEDREDMSAENDSEEKEEIVSKVSNDEDDHSTNNLHPSLENELERPQSFHSADEVFVEAIDERSESDDKEEFHDSDPVDKEPEATSEDGHDALRQENDDIVEVSSDSPTEVAGNEVVETPSSHSSSEIEDENLKPVGDSAVIGPNDDKQNHAIVDDPAQEPSAADANEKPLLDLSSLLRNQDVDETDALDNRVRFKQRYPVPPAIQGPRSADEITSDNYVPREYKGGFLSKPKPDLATLLHAVTGDSIPRRSNACGALKVLTKQKKNKLALARTAGFLDALVFAASAKLSSQDIESSQDARSRAIMVIANVSEPRDNRELVFSHPGLMPALVKAAVDGHADARTAACGALALLAKTPANREPMARTTNLIGVLAMILRGGKSEGSFDEGPNYSADDEDSVDHSCSSGSVSGSSMSSDDEDVTLPAVMSMREQQKERLGEIVERGQLNACATLIHLSKHCGATPLMCLNERLMDSLVEVAMREDPMHTKCLEILCNLSRFPHNTAFMSKYPGVLDALVVNGSSKDSSNRLWSLRTLQNLSSEVTGKTVLANKVVLEMLSVSVMRDAFDEQAAATATLYNLSTEPGAVVPLTNTKNVVATLVHVAHNPDSPSSIRMMACDALATLGLWMQTLAGAGTVPETAKENGALPSYITTGWKRWD